MGHHFTVRYRAQRRSGENRFSGAALTRSRYLTNAS